jgi:hypothetical protein
LMNLHRLLYLHSPNLDLLEYTYIFPFFNLLSFYNFWSFDV